jgi:hypothetical protein
MKYARQCAEQELNLKLNRRASQLAALALPRVHDIDRAQE